MAGKATIGALRVDLGLDSAQFHTGLKKAGTGLSGFGKTAKVALAAVATAAVAAGAALGVAVKGAIDHADQLSKTSQKIGVSVEALSRLEWAAKLSDVSLEQMSTGLKKLSQNLFEVASGAGATAQRGFEALGISATNANGTLRAADEVLADVADKFSRMEDGTAKTAIAVSLFGRAGAELIPMLNMGRDGLADMAAEADRLGITIDTKTGKAAEAFNDSLTRIGGVMDGLVNKIMVAVLPGLNSLSDTLASPEFQTAVIDTTKLFVGLADVLARTVALATALVDILPKAVNANEDAQLLLIPGQEEMYADAENRMKGHNGIGGGPGTFAGLQALMGIAPAASSTTAPNVFTPAIGGAKKLREEIEIAIPRVSEMQQRFTDLGTTIEGSVSSALSGVVKALVKGEDAVASLGQAFGRLGDKLLDMAFDQAIQGLFGTIMGAFGGGMGLGGGGFGRATYGGGGGFFPAFPSFAGGGFTGVGSRAGGIDGLGGFPAILHPNETVVDHTRGGGTPNLIVNVSGAKGNAEIMEMARAGAQEALSEWERWKAPGFVRHHAGTTLQENG